MQVGQQDHVAVLQQQQHETGVCFMSSGQLGTIVSWKVPATVSLGTLRSALGSAGLDSELAADMLPRNALKRALREMKEGRVIRQLRIEGDSLYFQFTQEHFGVNEITYDKEAELCLNMVTRVVTCDVPQLAVKAEQLMNEHLDKRLTSDLTRLVQKVFDSRRADLVPIRDAGGAYFVPAMHSDLVDKARTLLNGIDGKMRSFEVTLGSGETSESVADSLSEHLRTLIGQFRESCGIVSKESNKRVVETRHEQVAELRQKLECYSGLLLEYSNSINEQIAEAEQELLRNMMREPENAPDATDTAAKRSEAAKKAAETRKANAAAEAVK